MNNDKKYVRTYESLEGVDNGLPFRVIYEFGGNYILEDDTDTEKPYFHSKVEYWEDVPVGNFAEIGAESGDILAAVHKPLSNKFAATEDVLNNKYFQEMDFYYIVEKAKSNQPTAEPYRYSSGEQPRVGDIVEYHAGNRGMYVITSMNARADPVYTLYAGTSKFEVDDLVSLELVYSPLAKIQNETDQ